MNFKTRIIAAIYALFMTVFAIAIFLYSILLYGPDNYETELEKTVSLSLDVPTEFDSGGTFWWLLENKNSLYLTNYSNETKNIDLFMNLEVNPCNSTKKFIFNNTYYNFINEKLQIHKLFTLAPYEIKNLHIFIFSNKPCSPNNDTRKLGLKLRKWYVK